MISRRSSITFRFADNYVELYIVIFKLYFIFLYIGEHFLPLILNFLPFILNFLYLCFLLTPSLPIPYWARLVFV